MINLNTVRYRVATLSDCDSLVALVNNGYRGEIGRQGWTNENDLVDGHRTNTDAMNEMINNSDSIILVVFNKSDEFLIGCVYLQHKSDIKTAYLGMLTVRPDLQGRGYGKLILSLAENYARDQWNVDYIEITVVLQRTELLEFYSRRGYYETGTRQPFPPDEFGRPKRNDLQFCTLQKTLKI
jgi:ribosomal protein S18 acetylase RimI-like enzyme